jgi:hypothetical protein
LPAVAFRWLACIDQSDARAPTVSDAALGGYKVVEMVACMLLLSTALVALFPDTPCNFDQANQLQLPIATLHDYQARHQHRISAQNQANVAAP